MTQPSWRVGLDWLARGTGRLALLHPVYDGDG
jgi:hypothetical protein